MTPRNNRLTLLPGRGRSGTRWSFPVVRAVKHWGWLPGELLWFPFLEDLENLQGMNSPARNDWTMVIPALGLGHVLNHLLRSVPGQFFCNSVIQRWTDTALKWQNKYKQSYSLPGTLKMLLLCGSVCSLSSFNFAASKQEPISLFLLQQPC